MNNRYSLGFAVLAVASLLSGCGSGDSNDSESTFTFGPSGETTQLQRAECGPGSLPETGIQGRVSRADRESGRNEQGYRCNMELVGQYQGEGATWVNPSYGDCMYMGTAFGGILTKSSQGTQVVDFSDPANPTLSTNLTSPAMLTGPWESLKVNEERGLLAAVSGGPVISGAFFDIYDISGDCSQPRLRNSFTGNLTLPANFLGHEGNFSPDGNTYWATGFGGGALTAIDVSDPVQPRILYVGTNVTPNHGFSLSEDGNRMYLAMGLPAGLNILDVSDIQSREAVPVVRQVGSVFWNVAGISQYMIPVTYDGTPFIIAIDEFASESYKFIDISDETDPVIINEFRLEINRPENAQARAEDTGNTGLFGYESHYCTVDRKNNPTAMACGHFQSGIRVFDIRDPFSPREIAYYNPPAQEGKMNDLQGSEHAALLSAARTPFPLSDLGNANVAVPYLFDSITTALSDLSADWCSSPPRFVGSDQIWVTCQDNGAYPINE